MKTIVATLIIVFLAVQVKAQNEESTQKPIENEIVINHSMIERFNSCDYTEDQLSIFDILNNYSFEDTKLLMNGYNTKELDISSRDMIASYLSQEHKQMDNTRLLVEKPEDNAQIADNFADNSH